MKVRGERVQQAEITGILGLRTRGAVEHHVAGPEARQIGLIQARSRNFMNNAG
jgi:hypothetical protein